MELPPRTRRILQSIKHGHHNIGTTSAYAENTSIAKNVAHNHGNYLRVRGEYEHLPQALLALVELPPRTRRIPGSAAGASGFSGTTSAYAENTTRGNGDQGTRGNYLRVRGEYIIHSTPTESALELPPRTRRILMSVVEAKAAEGTTSAYAENTKPGSWRTPPMGNYLRVRGEYPR